MLSITQVTNFPIILPVYKVLQLNQNIDTPLAKTHVCHHCGFVEDRDINASINILKLGLSTVGHTGTYATGDLPSWAIGVNLSSNGESVNVESPRL